MFGFLDAMASTLAELVILALIPVVWWASGLRESSAGGTPWCGRRGMDTRDRIVIGCLLGVLVLSFVYWYQISHDNLSQECLIQTYGYGNQSPGTPAQSAEAAVCAAATRAARHHNGWYGFNWLLYPCLGLILTVLAGRIRGLIHPNLARISTRLLCLLADLLFVLAWWGRKPYETDRTWAAWSSAALVLIASAGMMRNTRWPPRWLAG